MADQGNNLRERKIVTLLRSFTKDEQSQFCLLVRSPYFNTDEKLTQLAVFLCNMLKKKRNNSLTGKNERKAFTVMFGDPKSSDDLTDGERAKLNDKLSRLTRLGIRYLQDAALEADPLKKTDAFLSQFHNRKLTSFYERYRDKEKAQLKVRKKDKDFYFNNYQLERSFFEFQFTFEINKLLKSDNLSGVMEALDAFYLVDRMLLHLAGMALINAGAKSYDFESMNYILMLSELPQYRDIPAIELCRTACYMETCKLLSKEHPEQGIQAQQHYEELVSLLNQYDKEFTRDMQLQFYTLAANFCSHQIKHKHQAFLQKGFELYRQLESKGLMSVNGILRAGTLIQAMTLACRTANYEWAETMLTKYLPQIDTRIREGVSVFIKGQIAFYRGDMDLADRLFMETEQLPFHRAYTLNSKIFRFKCIYESNQYLFEAAQAKFKSEINHRKNNKFLSKKDKESHINFIKILMDLYKTRGMLRLETNDKLTTRLNRIEEKLQAVDFVTDLQWLERKLGELRLIVNG